MKKILFIPAFIGYAIYVTGQEGNRQYDSLITRIVMRSIINDGYGGSPNTGATLLRIVKTDSIRMKSMYSSDSKYDYANDPNLLKRLNESGRNYIRGEYTVIVPIYFHYGDKIPSEEITKAIEDRLKELKLTTHVMKPVVIVTYPAARKTEASR
jgi:hypothetical protein